MQNVNPSFPKIFILQTILHNGAHTSVPVLGIMEKTPQTMNGVREAKNDEYERNDADAEAPESVVHFVEILCMFLRC